MKTIKTILILCVALCFATSCKKEVDMTLVQKTVLENADIHQIEVSDAWEVTVVADSRSYVELTYSAYLEPGLDVKMEGTKLEIGFTGNVYPVINSVFRATIHTMQLEKLEADDASKVQCSGDFTGLALEVELSDASNCFNGQIEASDRFEVELEDASRFVNKGGETAVARIKAHDASRLNMVETRVGEMNVDLSSASEATVWATNVIDGALTAASTLYYKGNPQIQVNCSEDSEIIPL